MPIVGGASSAALLRTLTSRLASWLPSLMRVLRAQLALVPTALARDAMLKLWAAGELGDASGESVALGE